MMTVTMIVVVIMTVIFVAAALLSSTGSTSPGKSIISLASGTTITVEDGPKGGVRHLGATIGFGSSESGINVGNGTTDTITMDTANLNGMNTAFSMPSDGTITSISAYFAVTVNLPSNFTSATIIAQIYTSTNPNEVFSTITSVELAPNITPPTLIAHNTKASLAISVTAETHIVMIFFAVVPGNESSGNNIIGYASAGLLLEI